MLLESPSEISLPSVVAGLHSRDMRQGGGELGFLFQRLRPTFGVRWVVSCCKLPNSAVVEPGKLHTYEPTPLVPRPLQLTPVRTKTTCFCFSQPLTFSTKRIKRNCLEVCMGLRAEGARGSAQLGHTTPSHAKVILFYFVVKKEPRRTSHMLGKHPNTEPHPRAPELNFRIWC